jgi:hypothetical protein
MATRMATVIDRPIAFASLFKMPVIKRPMATLMAESTVPIDRSKPRTISTIICAAAKRTR